jgi:hypothetical protein
VELQNTVEKRKSKVTKAQWSYKGQEQHIINTFLVRYFAKPCFFYQRVAENAPVSSLEKSRILTFQGPKAGWTLVPIIRCDLGVGLQTTEWLKDRSVSGHLAQGIAVLIEPLLLCQESRESPGHWMHHE